MVFRVSIGYSNKEVEIKQMDAKEGHKTLGVFLSPTGTNVKQKRAMRGKVDTWCSQMSKSGFP